MTLRFEDIRFNCALYNGYKPCKYGNECAGCSHYEPRQDAADASLASPLHAPSPSAPLETDSPKVLIIKTGAMGDVLRTTTVLWPLRRLYPNARVTWVTDASAEALLRSNPLIDELLTLNAQSFEELASRRFDLLLNYEKEKEPLSLAGKVQAQLRMGFAPTPWRTATVFNPESRYALLLGLSDELKFRQNALPYPQIIAEMAGFAYKRDPYILELSEASRRRQAQIEAQFASKGAWRIGLNTGCGAVFRTKQWTLEGWVGLVRFLQQNTRAQILLLGGKAERELNQQIAQHTQGVFDSGSDNSLEEFFGVVEACDLVVSSDSLAMHIAIARKKYVVALFGSTSHQEVDLYGRGEKIVTDFACSPCYKKACEDHKPTCMEALDGATVGQAVLRGLEQLKSAKEEPAAASLAPAK